MFFFLNIQNAFTCPLPCEALNSIKNKHKIIFCYRIVSRSTTILSKHHLVKVKKYALVQKTYIHFPMSYIGVAIYAF